MTWQRVFENPTKTDEQVKLERAVKRAEKLLRELAAGVDDYLDRRKKFYAVVKAVDKAEYLARWVEPEEREAVYSLRSKIAAAEDAGIAAVQRARDEERVRRIELERAGRPAPGSYKHELALMRGQRR